MTLIFPNGLQVGEKAQLYSFCVGISICASWQKTKASISGKAPSRWAGTGGQSPAGTRCAVRRHRSSNGNTANVFQSCQALNFERFTAGKSE